jgi:hypothetical protein
VNSEEASKWLAATPLSITRRAQMINHNLFPSLLPHPRPRDCLTNNYVISLNSSIACTHKSFNFTSFLLFHPFYVTCDFGKTFFAAADYERRVPCDLSSLASFPFHYSIIFIMQVKYTVRAVERESRESYAELENDETIGGHKINIKP